MMDSDRGIVRESSATKQLTPACAAVQSLVKLANFATRSDDIDPLDLLQAAYLQVFTTRHGAAAAQAMADTMARRTEEFSDRGNRAADLLGDTPTERASSMARCPHDRIVSEYHRALPDLPSVRLMPDSRKKALSAFWKWVLTTNRADGTRRATTPEEAIAWIGEYFDRAGQNDFLMGRTERHGRHANWTCDIDFLLSEKGKKQVIEKTFEQPVHHRD